MKSTDIWSEKVHKFGGPQAHLQHLFHVALIEPEIPQNTGNIGKIKGK